MRSNEMTRGGRWMLGAAVAALALAACSKQAPTEQASTPAATTTETAPAAPATTASPAAAAAGAPAADNTDTLSGDKFASFTGDVAKGEVAFTNCKTCHAVEEGVNKIGPSLHKIVGRAASTVAGYSYSEANKKSGITWTEEKLFQYLEKPQRVVPGTKMAFPGWADSQKRADVIAYLKTK